MSPAFNALPFHRHVLVAALPFRRHALAVALAVAVGGAEAATMDVSGDCTLFNAITNANTDTDTDGVNGCPAGNGADTLNLPLQALFDVSLPTVTSVITINGNGSTIDGQMARRPFTITTSGDLTLKDLTVTKGRATEGGGIYNQGRLTVVNSTITGNATFPVCDYYCFRSHGGGIFNTGTALLTNSIVSKNSTSPGFTINGESGFGGGIWNAGSMTLTNSTVSNNTALGGHRRWIGPSGGGIHNNSNLRLINSTVAGNRASGLGGGIRNLGIATLQGSTVSGNRAESGGGVYNGFFSYVSRDNRMTLTNSTVSGNSGDGITNARVSLTLVHATLSDNLGAGLRSTGAIKLTNSLLANSVGSGDCINSGGTLVTQGINMVEDGSCEADISGNPQLSALLNHGGYTATHTLSGMSPALDAADPTLCPAADQRGIARPQPSAAACDVGALERLTTVSLDIQSTMAFFRNAVSSGGLVGTGQDGLMTQRLKALRLQLLSAGHYKSRNVITKACDQLRRTLRQIDPNNTPDADDYVTGSAAGTLAGKIRDLLTTWTCQ